MNELAEAIGQILGRPVERRYAPPRAGDIRDSWADVAAAGRCSATEPRVDLEEGLRRTVELPRVVLSAPRSGSSA